MNKNEELNKRYPALDGQKENILESFEMLKNAYINGNKLLIAGNGGSAADSNHIAAEFVSKFQYNRNALPAISLSSNQSVITGIKADVVAGNNSFTISNVKLVPQAGSDISISTGYTIEVYDSDGEKVDNENLTAGDYQVIVSYGKYTKEVFDKTIEDQVSPVYSDITYLWVDNQCTATMECTNIPTLTITETVEGVVENVTAASVGHNRVDRLVANFTNSLFETQYSKEFEVPNTALEPVYADTTYLWDGDKCTAVLECTNDSSYTISETVTGVFTEVTAAGIGVNQTAKYIATFLDDKFETQESKIFEVEDTMITEVFTEAELKEALAIDGFSFDIGADIELTSSVTISNSVAINLCENTITTSIYRIVASNEDKDITVLIKNGQITGNTHVIRANQNSMVILEDLTITSTGTAVGSTNGTLIIISANITAGGSTVAAYEGAKVTINSGTFEGAYAVESNSEAKVEINGGTFKATSESGLVASGGTIIVNDGTITSQEFAVLVISEGTATINGGTFATLDNVVVGTNGTEGKGNNTITINDGTFNGNIVSSGYIACGVYVANSDTVEINGGTFNIKNGVGVVARSGNTTVSEDVVFNIVSDGTINSGKVGDATINIEEPHELVIDYLANYPGGEPTLINETEYEVYELKQTLEVESADELTAAFNYSHATIILNADIEYSGSLYIEKNAEVDLNGHTITFTQGKNFRVAGCEVIFKNGKLTGQTSHIIRSQNDAILTLINMDIETFATAVGATNATLIIESSNIVAGDAAVAGYYAANIIIKSWTFNGKNSVVANDYETIIDIQSGTFNGTDPAILSNGGTIAVASGVIISSDNSVEILSNGGTIVNDTNYVVYKLHNVNDETTLNDAMQEPNSYVVLQNDIALTTLNLIHVNGIIVIICGENSITDDGGSIEIGINTVIVTDNASIEVLLEAPEDYAINKKDNLDGTFTYSCIADEE